MQTPVCRIHVLKRFNKLEWILFVLIVNFLLIGVDVIGGYVYLASFGISIVFAAVISDISFSKEKYADENSIEMNRLLDRRYVDLLKYLTFVFIAISYKFILALLPFVVVVICLDYGNFWGLLAFLILIIFPAASAILNFEKTNKNSIGRAPLIFKLLDPYNKIMKKIELLHCEY